MSETIIITCKKCGDTGGVHIGSPSHKSSVCPFCIYFEWKKKTEKQSIIFDEIGKSILKISTKHGYRVVAGYSIGLSVTGNRIESTTPIILEYMEEIKNE